MTPQFKPNSGIDLSRWDLNLDMTSPAFTTKPSFVFAKATQGVDIKDPTFPTFMVQARKLNIPFGGFCFFCNVESSADQAKYFMDYINSCGGLAPSDRVCLDYEDDAHPKNYSLHEAANFFYILNDVYNIPFTSMVLYSRPSILNSLNSPKDWTYLLQIPFWTADPPDNPDAYATPPSFSIPNGMPIANVKIWQYYFQMVLPGWNAGLDADWIDPTYLAAWQAELGATPIPPVTPPAPSQVFPAKYSFVVNADGTTTPLIKE